MMHCSPVIFGTRSAPDCVFFLVIADAVDWCFHDGPGSGVSIVIDSAERDSCDGLTDQNTNGL